MNKSYSFTIEGRPKAKQSTRFTKSGKCYTDYSVANYQSLGKWKIKEKFRDNIITKPAKLEVKAYFSIPKSTKKHLKQKLLNSPYPHKPDGDNLLKMVCDILKDITIKDDNLITSKSIDKLYGERARTEIYLEVL